MLFLSNSSLYYYSRCSSSQTYHCIIILNALPLKLIIVLLFSMLFLSNSSLYYYSQCSSSQTHHCIIILNALPLKLIIVLLFSMLFLSNSSLFFFVLLVFIISSNISSHLLLLMNIHKSNAHPSHIHVIRNNI